MKNALPNEITIAKEKAQYDESVKKILSNKIILAHIIVKTIDEFKDMKPKDVVPYIVGDPYISAVPLDANFTNSEYQGCKGEKIVGFNTEDSAINEGLIRFDIIFYVRLKNGLTQIIVNIEAQKDEPDGYMILNRAIFYTSRMISSQKGRDFIKTNYDDIKQVFSIWICMNMKTNSMSHIHLVKDDILNSHPWKGDLALLNIIMLGITNEPPEHDEKYELHRLLSTLLSKLLNSKEKISIIESEYDIPMEIDLREDVNSMCNLSDGLVEDITKEVTNKVTEDLIINMYKNGISADHIAIIVKKTVDEVETIVTNS